MAKVTGLFLGAPGRAQMLDSKLAKKHMNLLTALPRESLAGGQLQQRVAGRCSGLHRRPRVVFVTNRCSTDELGGGVSLRRLADGVCCQAKLIGLACDLLQIDNEKTSSVEIGRQLDPAQTDGIIIGTFNSQLARLDWSRYAVVRINPGLMVPEATLVADDQMQNARTAVHNACRLGYRRIGMAVEQAEEEINRGLYSAGYYIAQNELLVPDIPILYFREHRDDTVASARRLLEWIQEHRIQIVLSSRGSIGELLGAGGLQVPRDIASICVCLNGPDPAFAGVIQDHVAVGQKAAEALALLIMYRKWGRATLNAHTYVMGTWQDGATAPPCGFHKS